MYSNCIWIFRKIKAIFLLQISIFICGSGIANDELFKHARQQQREGCYDEAIEGYKKYLTTPIADDDLTDSRLFIYTEALIQLMNTYQSKGDTEGCVVALQEVFDRSPILQKQCIRDYYSVLGYALSRTERMEEAENTMLRAMSLPLYQATPERYFRDYAYAAAIFYSNTEYQEEVISWCQEALRQAELCKNTSGAQWVKAMLGSIYKRNGHLNSALELFHQSRDEAEQRNDTLGIINSLHALTDLFLYWDIPEYADLYASEAVRVQSGATVQNPMVSAQTYINKGRALLQLGEIDSVAYYAGQAHNICESMPYNSGMVDVDLLNGCYLTSKGGADLELGIKKLKQVTSQGTTLNRAKAYHQLALTCLQHRNDSMAEEALDSLYVLLNAGGDTPMYIRLDYEPILKHYMQVNDKRGVERFTHLMLQEEKIFREKGLKYNIVESIVELQTMQKRQELKLAQLKQKHQHQLLLISISLAVVIISVIVIIFFKQRKVHSVQMRKVNERFTKLSQELYQSNAEKEKMTQEIKEFLKDSDNRQEMETLTPFILRDEGETKFRQCFELLHPLFLHRLRDKVPTITRREELLSMLIVLKQSNKEIAELLAIAPRSVLMLRHRFRQKIGLTTEFSLENFIDELLESNDNK